VEWLAGGTEVLGENLPQCRFVHHKPHMLSGREPGPPQCLKLTLGNISGKKQNGFRKKWKNPKENVDDGVNYRI
jgi:hypothetical protein